MTKKTGLPNLLVALIWLGTLGALLSNFARLIPNNVVSWGILAVAIVITFGASFTGLSLLRKNSKQK
ncbi:hypothetical protein QUF99_11780 [Bacillus sp. DX4.1]|uniref:hypothetical protein n=1 Tax=Bacillus sp. DX4.1 TaxID=3055867 RepID=UPI0025A1089A|nr:hypothetical protein [Bacillus sp. DX4.1]MDM5187981.1 hypothetical protein [Bacillus sp. DX4.1]